MQADATLDASGLKCPLPVLKTRKALKPLGTGQVLAVITTDPASPKDMDAFCQASGHTMLACQTSQAPYHFYIQKA